MSLLGDVIDVLIIGKRLRVGIGNARQMMLDCNIYNIRWRQLVEIYSRRKYLRDIMVLTVETTEVATCTGQRQTSGSGMELIQWILLYRIICQSTRFTVNNRVKHSVKIPSAATFSMLAFQDNTTVGT